MKEGIQRRRGGGGPGNRKLYAIYGKPSETKRNGRLLADSRLFPEQTSKGWWKKSRSKFVRRGTKIEPEIWRGRRVGGRKSIKKIRTKFVGRKKGKKSNHNFEEEEEEKAKKKKTRFVLRRGI